MELALVTFIVTTISCLFVLSDLTNGLLFSALVSLCFVIVFTKYKASITLTRVSITVLSAFMAIAYLALRFQFMIPASSLSQQIETSLPVKAVIEGKVLSVVVPSSADHQRFNVSIKKLNNTEIKGRQLIRLSAQGLKKTIKQGDVIQARVKIKPASGFENRFGFNYRRWALQNDIRYSGYVIDNYSILSRSVTFRQEVVDGFVEQYRELSQLKYLLALGLGNKSQLKTDDYQLLNQYGIGHLFAISGLHIAVIFLFLTWCIRLSCRVFKLPVPLISLYAISLSIIWFYVYTTGGAVSTIRAATLLTVWFLLKLWSNHFGHWRVFLFVAFVSLLVEPLYPLSLSWWLTFTALFAIYAFLNFVPNRQKVTQVDSGIPAKLEYWFLTFRHYFVQLLWLQGFIFLFTAPVLLVHLGQLSLSGLWINLLAIPLFSMVIIPLVFVATLLTDISAFIADSIMSVANEVISQFLQFISEMPFNDIVMFIPNGLGWFLAIGLLTFVLYPKLFHVFCYGKLPVLKQTKRKLYTSLILFCVGFYIAVQNNKGFIDLHLLDVGQGLSVVVKRQNEAMVYDLGPIYPSGYNATESVVLPTLLGLGISKVPFVVISHLDSDHKGNLKPLLDRYPEAELVSCEVGSYHWHEIDIDILSPSGMSQGNTNSLAMTDNDHSCVLKLTFRETSVLLPGDISSQIEEELVKKHKSQNIDLNSEILVSSHHGSKHSSSENWLKLVAPNIVLHSAGRFNRFGFPTKETQQRVENVGARQYTTNQVGEVILRIWQDNKIELLSYLRNSKLFWHDFFVP